MAMLGSIFNGYAFDMHQCHSIVNKPQSGTSVTRLRMYIYIAHTYIHTYIQYECDHGGVISQGHRTKISCLPHTSSAISCCRNMLLDSQHKTRCCSKSCVSNRSHWQINED